MADWLTDIYRSSDRSSGAFVGEAAALSAAVLWAAATLMFGKLGRQLAPLALNLVKGLFAIAFILLTLALQSRFELHPAAGMPLPIRSTIYLLMSGAVGIGLGDTAYFAAINALGARRALLLETLAPPMTAALAWIFLGERLGLIALAGIGLTLGGVAWVISERVPGTEKSSNAGIKVALLATFCQAAGAVLSRAALANTAVDPLLSALLRLLAGLLLMGALATLRFRSLDEPLPADTHPQNRWHSSLVALKAPKLLGIVAVTAFFGTYLAIWLQQIALKYTAAGIAQSLLATSPLFVLPMAAWLGDRISWRAIGGAAIALSGVWLLFYTR